MDRTALPWPRILFAAVVLGTVVGFFVYPTYPNYDSLYSLIWGREILHGHTPSFEAYRAPTEHPLAIAFGAVLSLFGTVGDRLMVGATLASFVALVAGLYRLAAASFTPLVGVVAGALLLTRFDFAFLAARGYIDIPYLALVVWAAALEAGHDPRRPGAGARRRGLPVFVLLGLAGLMRPEAWLLSGLYWLWWAWPRDGAPPWRERIAMAAIGVAPALAWMALDAAVTGDPLFSLNSTTTLADELGRAKGLSAVPHATWAFLVSLDKRNVLLAAIAGLLLALVLVPRRAVMPLVMLAIGLATFGLVGLGGLSIINRYLLVASLMVMIFAAVLVAGWTMVEPGRVRTAWMAASGAAVLAVAVLMVVHLDVARFRGELGFRGSYRSDLQRVLSVPTVEAARRCGPISTPNHKLIPDIRWVQDLPEDAVIARSDPAERRRTGTGVALYVSGRYAVLRQALVTFTDDPLTEVPRPGFIRAAVRGYYGAYTRCPRPAS